MSLRPELALAVLLGALTFTGCDRDCAESVRVVEVEPRAFSWDDELQLGVFRPNGTKVFVTDRGEIPANAYHAVRVNLPKEPEVTPMAPEGLTWRVDSALVAEPKAELVTELVLRRQAYVGHAANWAADVVGMRARLVAEAAEESEAAEAEAQRAKRLEDAIDPVSPRTGETIELPALSQDRRLRFVWAQRPTLADFALDADRPLETGIVVVGDCEAGPAAREWAEGRGVRVVSLDDPEAAAVRAFFDRVTAEPVKLPFLAGNGFVVSGFEESKWSELFHGKKGDVR